MDSVAMLYFVYQGFIQEIIGTGVHQGDERDGKTVDDYSGFSDPEAKGRL